ncbi:hypothetical protein PV326_006550 [Microctonus aethiopoides]|uniref:Replication protein A3 n=1 Tax=Microctonus aethiopoides TaxID=144406 RepID=A0AA39FKK7_9HYME|nr:hypothetical protein PV326_006550 [Microctonus aethiopoides]KAK0171322.1 hypothetical protein PV328_009067 [Microctonus aethiopoides]
MFEGRLHLSGKYIAQNIGKNVVLEGFLTKMSSDGKSVELTTFDKQKINVTLSQPYSDEVSGIMQVFGTVRSKSAIAAESYVRFPPEEVGKEEFDPEDHNDCMTVLHVTEYQNLLKSVDIVTKADDNETNMNEFPDDEDM